MIRDHLSEMKTAIPLIVEGPFYYGVEKLADSSVILRVVAKTEEIHKKTVLRGLNREMKVLFDKHGITIPFPQIVVHQENDKSSN